MEVSHTILGLHACATQLKKEMEMLAETLVATQVAMQVAKTAMHSIHLWLLPMGGLRHARMAIVDASVSRAPLMACVISLRFLRVDDERSGALAYPHALWGTK